MRTNDEIISLIQENIDEKGLSMSELARRVGIAKSTMSRYFNKILSNKTGELIKASEKSEVFLLS